MNGNVRRRVSYPDPLASVRRGDLVEIRYKDHSFFKDADPSKQTPQVLTAVGRVHYMDDEFVRLTLETYSNPVKLAMGLVILAGDIIELRRFNEDKSKAIRKDSFLGSASGDGCGK